MNAYVINLKERKDRWSHIQNKLSKFPFQLQKFEALRGNLKETNVTPFVKSCLTYNKQCTKYHIESLGGLGCALSHIEIWKKISDTSFIFEDDADPMEFAKQGIEQAIQLMHSNVYDVIFLGSHSPPTLKGSTTLVPWSEGGKLLTGAWAYIITPLAAKKLLENVHPLDLQIDIFIQSIPLRFGYISCFKQRFFLQPPDIQHLEEKIYSQNQVYQYLIFSILTVCIFTFIVTRYLTK